jgi:DnaJ-class molecular chaperone
MKLYIKEKCKHCAGCGNNYWKDPKSIAICPSCQGRGCIKIGIITYVFLFVARQLNLLLKRYGE